MHFFDGDHTYDYETTDCFRVFISQVNLGKEHYYHGILVNEGIGDKLFVSTPEQSGADFYNILMEKFNLPLLDWWGKPLLEDAIRRRKVNPGYDLTDRRFGLYSKSFSMQLAGYPLQDLEIYDLSLYGEADLKESICFLFKSNKIYISPNWQNAMQVKTMDDYFQEYGHTLVENFEKIIDPLSPLDGEVNSLALRSIRLYPQQGAMVNGALRHLRTSKYIILNEGMGVGKTCQAFSICEGYFVEKYLRTHPGSVLRDAYTDRNIIKYRNIVMCPGHMVEKWASEIAKQVPFVKVHILSDFGQLIKLRRVGSLRTGREFWVVSKDFAKLSYMQSPTPVKMSYKRKIHMKECDNCGESFFTPGRRCPLCGEIGFHKGELIGKTSGMLCPECGEVILENKNQKIEIDGIVPLLPEDFACQSQKNQNCFYCGAILWQPFVANVDRVNLFSPKIHPSTWYRVTHYANKACKAVKSVWVHKRFANQYFNLTGEMPLKERPDMVGVRKYSPATFIKRYMKGFFDFAIFDECHLYKGGATGQGNAMDALIKSSQKQLALTGTIAGGMAEHLFYLLYRLDPAKMVDKGYKWTDVMKFTEIYGTLEREYQLEEQKKGNSNLMCRGRQIGSPRAKPGISPCIFTDFLIDSAVFLDLSDMSGHLPPLKEMVVTVPLEGSNTLFEMFAHYNGVIKRLKLASREKGGKGLLGKMLQFSLSYLDKPFGDEVIVNPYDGSIVATIEQYPQLWEDGLLPKEVKLIEIVKSELSEGRKCFVFAEYTASPNTCVTGRLKNILERELEIKVAILESSSPEPLKREQWLRDMAEKEDIDVFICNPRCVETGLDFCWEKDGVWYNYPTLIFYQMGYSLFTIWQASRRAYRLIQRLEFRTYYMAFFGTIQEVVIRLIAEKQVATSAIQGKFSVEGLSAMAKGVDAKLIMAQALSENDFSSKNDLQAMFDVLGNANEKDSMSSCRPMLLLSEVIGMELLAELDLVDKPVDIDALFAELFENEDDIFLAVEQKENPFFISESKPELASVEKQIDIMSLFKF